MARINEVVDLGTVDLGTKEVSVDLDMTDGFTVLRLAGFAEDDLDLVQAIVAAESGWYGDAVGDTSLISAKWGPSIGLFQIRALRSPTSFGSKDYWRYNAMLRNPLINAMAAFDISDGGTNWEPWSTFTSGSYKNHLGVEVRPIQTGHSKANQWWI